MEELVYFSQEKPKETAPDDYEQMYNLLYAYRFGSISFLELLDKFEAILHINASQVNCQPDHD